MRGRPEPPGSSRMSAYFGERRRYQRDRWVAVAAGVLIVVLAAGIMLASGQDFTLGTALLLLIGAELPWLLVEGLWRWARWWRF